MRLDIYILHGREAIVKGKITIVRHNFKLIFIFLIYSEKMNVGHRMKQRRKELKLSTDDVAEITC